MESPFSFALLSKKEHGLSNHLPPPSCNTMEVPLVSTSWQNVKWRHQSFTELVKWGLSQTVSWDQPQRGNLSLWMLRRRDGKRQLRISEGRTGLRDPWCRVAWASRAPSHPEWGGASGSSQCRGCMVHIVFHCSEKPFLSLQFFWHQMCGLFAHRPLQFSVNTSRCPPTG